MEVSSLGMKPGPEVWKFGLEWSYTPPHGGLLVIVCSGKASKGFQGKPGQLSHVGNANPSLSLDVLRGPQFWSFSRPRQNKGPCNLLLARLQMSNKNNSMMSLFISCFKHMSKAEIFRFFFFYFERKSPHFPGNIFPCSLKSYSSVC